MNQPAAILIADDDRNICELLNLYLSRDGYRLLFAHDGSQALDVFHREQPDLILLDIMLPIINGWEVCRLIRQSSDVPIIMITARDASEDKVSGLDMGADDYVVKPFDPGEVAARVRAQLRKLTKEARTAPGRRITVGDLVIDNGSFEVLLKGVPVELTPKEFQLLQFLAANRNLVLSREQLLEQVWGYQYPGETRTVDMHIKKLREKLGSGGDSWQIKTIYGIGYKFEAK